MASEKLKTHFVLIIQQHVYESRKSQILNAKGTLKAPKNNKERKNSIISDEISSFQFFLHEKDFEEHSTREDSTSLVSEEDFAGFKEHVCSIPEDGSLTIRSHRGIFIIKGVSDLKTCYASYCTYRGRLLKFELFHSLI